MERLQKETSGVPQKKKHRGPVVLFSGGPDSLIAWWLAGKPDRCLYMNLGHKYAKSEVMAIKMLESIIPQLNVTECDDFNLADWEKMDAEIPSRNLFLLTAAMERMCDGDPYCHLVLAVQAGEQRIPDRTEDFRLKMQDILSLLKYAESGRVTVDYALSGLTKAEAVKEYLMSGGQGTFLKLSWSCYGQDKYACGNCSACFRRWVAFSLNGIEEDWKYQFPWLSGKAQEYWDNSLLMKYGPSRSHENVQALTQRGWKDG